MTPSTGRTIAEQANHSCDYCMSDECLHAEASLDKLTAVIESALTAARAEAREAVAEMMLQSALATGHGDTLGDLLTTLAQQVEELRAERDVARAELAEARNLIGQLMGDFEAAMVGVIGPNGEYPHILYCSASRRHPAGTQPGCVCLPQVRAAKAEGAREALEQAAEELGLRARQEFNGYFADAAKWLRARVQEGR